ncbi:MAG: TolC family protein [Gammaproteobacteria bacterium]
MHGFYRWPGSLALILYGLSGRLLGADDARFVGLTEASAEQFVAATLAANPTLPVREAAWEAARARAAQATALADPTLSYAFAPETLGDSEGEISHAVELSQRLSWPGKRGLRGLRAEHEAQAVREDIDAARLKLIAAAKDSFADWYYVHSAISVNRANQELLKEFQTLAELRYSTGSGSKQDALRAEVESNMLEHRAIVLDRERREALTRLNTLLNRVPDQALPPPADLPEPEALPSAETLRRLALARRPELLALGARMAAQGARIDLARRDFYPDFDVSARYDTFWDRDEQRLALGLSVNVPLDQTKRQAALDEARATRMRTELAIAERRAAIAGEVQRAYDRVEESKHVLALYRQKLLPLAAENLQAAQADYEAGAGDFLTLLSAEQNLLRTELTAIRARADYYRRLAMLEYSAGGAP